MQHLPSRRNLRGFASVAVLLGLGLAFLVVSGIYTNYKTTESQKFGATVYTTQLSDTINTFRQQVNSSTANLNTELTAVSTTINAYGNIVSENTPLAVAKGGTATTTAPSNNQFLSANGSNPAWKSIVAGSGMTITSSTTSTTFSTTGINQSSSYVWDGLHTFQGGLTSNSSTLTGTSTFTGALTLPTSTMLVSSSTPTGDKNLASKYYVDNRTVVIASGAQASESVGSAGVGKILRSLSIPAMGINDVLEVEFETYTGDNASTSLQVASSSLFSVTTNNTRTFFKVYIKNRGATNSQVTNGIYSYTSLLSITATSSIETNAPFTLNVVMTDGDGSGTMTSEYFNAILHRAN